LPLDILRARDRTVAGQQVCDSRRGDGDSGCAILCVLLVSKAFIEAFLSTGTSRYRRPRQQHGASGPSNAQPATRSSADRSDARQVLGPDLCLWSVAATSAAASAPDANTFRSSIPSWKQR